MIIVKQQVEHDMVVQPEIDTCQRLKTPATEPGWSVKTAFTAASA